MSNEKPTSSKKKAEDKLKNKRESSTEKETETETETTIESIRQFFAQKLSLASSLDAEDGHAVQKVIDDLSFDGLGKHWKDKGFKNIIVMVGAGISTSAGIPDFRSPGSGLYDNLQKYKLPHPTAIFEMDYFLDNPQPFYALAKELYPGTFKPTPAHYFVRLLHEKGLLLRHYTQNIDTLERITGIPDDKLVEAHGTFFTNHCLGCHKLYSMEWMKQQIFNDSVPACEVCNAIVKPDIVFFGENLPEKFYTMPSKDFKKCDLLIIMGTSLEVQPFASLIDHAGPQCMRLLINRTKVGHDFGLFSSFFMSGSGMLLDSDKNTRDVAYIGDCDDGVMALAAALGWTDELNDLIEREHARLDKEEEASKKQSQTTAELDDKKEEDQPKKDSTAKKATEKPKDDKKGKS